MTRYCNNVETTYSGFQTFHPAAHVYYVPNTCLCLPQTLSFYFPPCGKIPPPVIMVQNVSFKYSDNTVSTVNTTAWTPSHVGVFLMSHHLLMFPVAAHI